jgi:hypothetical protein
VIAVIVAVVSLALFAVALSRVGISTVAAGAWATTSRALDTAKEAADERVRERAMRQASVQLAGCVLSMAGRTAFAAAIALVPAGIASALRVSTLHEVVTVLGRWEVSAAATLAFGVFYFVRTCWWITS